MGLHSQPAKVETQTGALPTIMVTGLVKAFKDVSLGFGRNTLTSIADPDFNTVSVVCYLCGYSYLTACRG